MIFFLLSRSSEVIQLAAYLVLVWTQGRVEIEWLSGWDASSVNQCSVGWS